MRKVVVSELVTLDGVMEDPSWTFQWPFSKDQLDFKLKELMAADALLLGRVTYQGFAAAWPSMTDAQGYADRMNDVTKYVVSKTLRRVEWKGSTLLSRDLAEEVSKLKHESGGDILVFGSCSLSQALLELGLVDELTLMVFPLVLGNGRRLFKDPLPASAKPIEARAFESGVVLLRYELTHGTRRLFGPINGKPAP